MRKEIRYYVNQFAPDLFKVDSVSFKLSLFDLKPIL